MSTNEACDDDRLILPKQSVRSQKRVMNQCMYFEFLSGPYCTVAFKRILPIVCLQMAVIDAVNSLPVN